MFKIKLDELGFLLAYPLQIFVVSPFYDLYLTDAWARARISSQRDNRRF